jgi:hypothetical protein
MRWALSIRLHCLALVAWKARHAIGPSRFQSDSKQAWGTSKTGIVLLSGASPSTTPWVFMKGGPATLTLMQVRLAGLWLLKTPKAMKSLEFWDSPP